MTKNTVRVYDTITKKYVEVEVNETVRTYYDRTQWNIEDNDKSFYKHEIQFSALKGNINGELENFKEFRTDDDSVEKCIIRQAEYQLCKHVNHTAGMKSRQPHEPYAKTSNERAITMTFRPLNSFQSRR